MNLEIYQPPKATPKDLLDLMVYYRVDGHCLTLGGLNVLHVYLEASCFASVVDRFSRESLEAACTYALH